MDFGLSDGRTDGRTDTQARTNDGRGRLTARSTLFRVWSVGAEKEERFLFATRVISAEMASRKKGGRREAGREIKKGFYSPFLHLGGRGAQI